MFYSTYEQALAQAQRNANDTQIDWTIRQTASGQCELVPSHLYDGLGYDFDDILMEIEPAQADDMHWCSETPMLYWPGNIVSISGACPPFLLVWSAQKQSAALGSSHQLNNRSGHGPAVRK